MLSCVRTVPARHVGAGIGTKKEEDLESNGAEFLTYTQACKQLNLTRPLLRRRVEAGTLNVYSSGRNIKLHLLARRELEDMVRIKPHTERSVETSDAVRVA
jgi:excisionase family DNA binding protein